MAIDIVPETVVMADVGERIVREAAASEARADRSRESATAGLPLLARNKTGYENIIRGHEGNRLRPFGRGNRIKLTENIVNLPQQMAGRG